MKWIINNKKVTTNIILIICTVLSLMFSIIINNKNKKLSERLELSQNNIEFYQGVINNSQQDNNVLKLQINDLRQYNDEIICKLDSVRKTNKIKDLNVAATQTQEILLADSKEIRGKIISVKDTLYRDVTYTDSIKYNNLTNVFYSISKDSVTIKLNIKNTQYLYIYEKKEYKNKKNFWKRLITLDWKKVTKHKYKIINTNDLLKESDVRIIKQE